MPNRPALRRGGPREQAVLEALRAGATRQAAAAAGGVNRKTLYRHMERSAAFANDVALAEDTAERRMTQVVWHAAEGGDVKAAMFWLERRRAADYRVQSQQQIEAHHDVDLDVLALAQRYSGLTDAQMESEIRKLDWVERGTEQLGAVAPGADAERGAGTATPLPSTVGEEDDLTDQPNAADETADMAPTPAEALNHTSVEPLRAQGPLHLPERVEPMACAHCRGQVPGRHEPGCPVWTPEGRLRIGPGSFGGVDPR